MLVQPRGDSDAECFQTTVQQYYTGNGVELLFFGSAHISGLNAVYADASVHQISFNIDVPVFNALGTRNGQETLNANQP